MTAAPVRPTCYLCREPVKGKQRTVDVAAHLCHELCAKRWAAAYEAGCALCEKAFDLDVDAQVVRDGFQPPSVMVLYHEACWDQKIASDVNEGLYGAVKEGWLESKVGPDGQALFKMTDAGNKKVEDMMRGTEA